MDFANELRADASTQGSITPDRVSTSQIETVGDQDWFRIELVEGARYQFDLGGATGRNSLANPLLKLLSNNVVVAEDADSGPGLSSRIIYTAESSGVHFLSAEGIGAQTGEYELRATLLDQPSAAPRQGSLLESIDWGTGVGTNQIDVYFAEAGETFAGHTSFGWSESQIADVFSVFDEIETDINVTFNRVSSPDDAEFRLVLQSSNFFAGVMFPPGEENAGVGILNFASLFSGEGVRQGSAGFQILLHEFGHGLGLAHPHDRGGSSVILNGVTSAVNDFGDFDLNQGVFTTQSLNNGYRSVTGIEPSRDSGRVGTLSPLDIAVLQQRYGARENANDGATVYELPTGSGVDAFYSAIYDTSGIDVLLHTGTTNATLDLRAATLEYEVGGGGFVSRVDGVFGGYTIANGVVIENAIGGSGNDTIIGNDADNRLQGGQGIDTLTGGAGADVFAFEGNDQGGVVADFTVQDSLEFSSGAVALSVLHTAEQSGADSLLTFNGSQIILRDVVSGQLIQLGKNISISPVPIASQGDDTYIYGVADRGLTISTQQEDATSGTNDRLIFKDLALSEVEFRHSDGKLEIIGPSASVLLADKGQHIEHFEFADGSVIGSASADIWSRGRDSLSGTSGDNKIHGGNDGASYGVLGLSGLGGNDDLKGAFFLQGGTGSDTYRIAQGDATRLIYGETSGSDRIIFEDIALADVSFELIDTTWIQDRLRISWTNDDGSHQYVDVEQDGTGIESFAFADGSVVGSASTDLWSRGRDRLLGTSDDDRIHGGNDGFASGVLFLSGLDGNDDLKGAHYLQGGAGNDTYRIAQGDATRLIYGETSGEDRILFEDIALADVSFELVDTRWIQDRLRISWTNDDGSHQYVDVEQDGAGIESFAFADESVIGSASADIWNLGRDRLLGTSRDDKIHAGNDGVASGVLALSGLGGDDDLKGAYFLQGGTGNDTYRIAQGDSTRLIYREISGEDRIIFEDITLADVSFELVDTKWIQDRLRISWTNDDGSNQHVDVEQDGAVIEQFEFADGSVLTYDELLI